jgi:hypothetical protein
MAAAHLRCSISSSGSTHEMACNNSFTVFYKLLAALVVIILATG